MSEATPNPRSLRISVIGIRGMPPRYGGAETATHEIGRRLVSRGHQVTVYGRLHNSATPRARRFDGMDLVHLPSLHTKNLDTPTHVLLCALHALTRGRPQVVLLSGVGTWFVMPLLQIFGIRAVMWADGKDWERGKWSRFARRYLRWSARMSVVCADAIVTDTRIAQRHYLEHFNARTRYIPHGADARVGDSSEQLRRFGLDAGQYLLFVGRLIPDKGVHYLIEAFRGLDTARKLVIVGDNPYNPDYVESLRRAADDRVIFTGYVFDAGFVELMQHCRIYVQPSDVEGTSPVLLTAMALGRPVVVNGIPENLETVGEAGASFRPGDVEALRALLERLLEDEPQLARLGTAAANRVREHYAWDRVVEHFEQLFLEVRAASEALPEPSVAP